MSMKFSIRLYKAEKHYIGRVPELGITTQGTTKEGARRNPREAIQTHLEAMAYYARRNRPRASELDQAEKVEKELRGAMERLAA
ncbi:MAG: type II toxin-antitoxin system HicB family antitoxin [Nitrososphaerota archaeon]|nr:type II toxin-antitoxin system HicB family antitoxin [Nitrososphaerota archaeon]